MADKYGTKKKKKYLSYFKEERAAGRTPKSYSKYKGKKKTTKRTKQVSGALKKAGLSYEDVARLRGK